MRIECRHGFYIFEEDEAGEISRFASKFELSIVKREDGIFTFEDLEPAKDYAIEGVDYLGATPTETYSGKPWEIMRANDLVYDFTRGELRLIQAITTPLVLPKAANYFITDGLLLAGSIASSGARLSDFCGFYLWSSAKFRYTEVKYVELI